MIYLKILLLPLDLEDVYVLNHKNNQVNIFKIYSLIATENVDSS